MFERIEFIDVTDNLIAVASQPLPFAIRSLDAIHLATALDWKQRNHQDLTFATHDRRLASAAHQVGFDVLGT